MAEDQETEKVKLDVSDFAVKFEQDVSVRSHLRDDKRVLFEEGTEEKIKVACDDHIHAILKIVLTKAVATEGIPQPPIHPLRDQLEVLYKKCGRTNVDQEQIVRDSWYIRKFTGFVKMKTRKRQVSEEPKFQELCLILNPGLQATCDEVNEKVQLRIERKKAKKATQEKKENDDYDDSDKGSQCDSDSGSSHGSDDGSEVEGVDIPAPAQSAPVPATGSVPRAGPPDAGKDVPKELLLSQTKAAESMVDVRNINLEDARKRLAELRERKARLNAEIFKMKSEPLEEPLRGPAGTTKVSGPSLPAMDNAETLPMGDIMGESCPTESLLPTSSPDVETSKIRANYQRRDVEPRSPDHGAGLTSCDPVCKSPDKAETPDSAAVADTGTKPFVTRDQQLRRKAATKGKRGKNKCKKNKHGKKGKTNGKGGSKLKRARSRSLNTLRAHSSSPMSKKRQTRNDGAEKPASVIPSACSAEKRKGKPKESKAKHAARPKQAPKAKAAPKRKAAAKAEAAKPKAKARGRPKSEPHDPKVIRQRLMTDEKYAQSQVDDIKDFCSQVLANGGEKVTAPQFKKYAKSLIPEFWWFSIQNIYWTRGSVGLTNVDLGKDVLHFSFNQSSASEAHRMAAALKCAIIAATALDNEEPFEKDSPEHEMLKHNCNLALFLLANGE